MAKLASYYKPKPKVEDTRLNAEGLGNLMFNDNVNQEGILGKLKDIISAKYEAFKKWLEERKKNKTQYDPEYRLTKAGKDKLKKEIEKQQNDVINYLKKNKLVKDVEKWVLHFGPLNHNKADYEEIWKMQSGEKYDLNFLPEEDELLYLVAYSDILMDEDDDPLNFYSDLEDYGWYVEEDSDIYRGIIGFHIKRSGFKENADYTIYDPNTETGVNQEGIVDTIKGWFGQKKETPNEITYTLGTRAKTGLLSKKDFNKAYCFPTNNLFPYIYNYLFKNPADVKKYVMAVADNFNRLIALAGKPGVVDPVKVSKALKDVNQFLNPRIVRKSTNDNIIYGLSYTDMNNKQKTFDINTAAMLVDMRYAVDGKYPIVYLDTEYAQQIDRLTMELNPNWLSQYGNYLDPSIIKVLINDYKQYKETYLKLDKKIPNEARREFAYTLPEVYSTTDQIDNERWNDTLVSAMGQMVETVEFIEDMVDAIAELSIADDNIVQELISEYNLKKA